MILKLWKMISPRILRVYYASKQAQALLENCTFYIAEILLMLLSAGVWYVCVHWEPWVKVNKHTSPPPQHVTARRSQVHPKIGRFVDCLQKCAKIYGKNCSQIGKLSRAIASTTRPCLVLAGKAFALLSPSTGAVLNNNLGQLQQFTLLCFVFLLDFKWSSTAVSLGCAASRCFQSRLFFPESVIHGVQKRHCGLHFIFMVIRSSSKMMIVMMMMMTMMMMNMMIFKRGP